jgi:hypothetical protein
VFPGNALALSSISREENGDGMECRTSEAANPLLGTISTRIAEDFRTSDYTLPKFLWERCE